jgi:hypothetical protein
MITQSRNASSGASTAPFRNAREDHGDLNDEDGEAGADVVAALDTVDEEEESMSSSDSPATRKKR